MSGSQVNQLDGKKEEHPLEFARLAHSFEKLEQASARFLADRTRRVARAENRRRSVGR